MPVEIDSNAVRRNVVGNAGQELGNIPERSLWFSESRGDVVVDSSDSLVVSSIILALSRFEQIGKHLPKQLGGRAHFEVWADGFAVMTSNKAPEFSALQDRNGHRGADAHVAKILQVNWRNAPQSTHGKVELIPVGCHRRQYRNRLGV